MLVWQWIRFSFMKQYAKRMKLMSFLFDWYYIVCNLLKFSPCIRRTYSSDDFHSLSYHPLLFHGTFGRSVFFCKIFLSCQNNICRPIVVSITTNQLMLISKSILNFLDLLTERVLVKLFWGKNNCVSITMF